MVVESAAGGVPAVTLSVPGLRDAVRAGETGRLVDVFGLPEQALADGIVAALRVLADPQVADVWAQRCVDWAGRFTWSATADHLPSVLTAEDLRLAPGAREKRHGTDDAVITVVPADLARLVPWDALRVTDRVDARGGETAVLLYGADTRRVLHRIGVDLSDPRVTVRAAGSRDLLGWRSGGHATSVSAAAARAGITVTSTIRAASAVTAVASRS